MKYKLKINIKKFLKNHYVDIVLLIILIVLIIVFIIRKYNLVKKKKIVKEKFFGQNLTKNRVPSCLKTYSNKDYSVKFQGLNEQYYNPFYKKMVDYYLRDYYISTSFKSYMPCGYSDDVCALESIRDILNKGARCINLDLFYDGDYEFDPDNKIVVGRVVNNKLNYLKSIEKEYRYLEFKDCLKLIDYLAWKKCNYPLILYLNLEFRNAANLENLIAKDLMDYIGVRFIDKQFGFQRYQIGNIPIRFLKNKLIIVTNYKPISPVLNEIVNGIINPDSNSVLPIELSKKDEDYGGIRGKMPEKNKSIQFTRENMCYVFPKIEYLPNDKYRPKINVNNLNFKDSLDYGIQMFAMNFQQFDENMKEYNKFFKNSGFIPKPIGNKFENKDTNLVFMPKPLNIKEQDYKFTYQPKEIKVNRIPSGWIPDTPM